MHRKEKKIAKPNILENEVLKFEYGKGKCQKKVLLIIRFCFIGKCIPPRNQADGRMWSTNWNNPAKTANNWNQNQRRKGKSFSS